MTQKCHLCKEEIATTFLDKIKGTIIKIKGKNYHICSNCQKKHKDKLKEKNFS